MSACEVRLTPDGRETLTVAYQTDVGCVRSNNEDSVGFFPSDDAERGNVFVVADGMGGAAAGEVASRLAVAEVQRMYFRQMPDFTPGRALKRSIETANATIFRKALEEPDLAGMGTTCTAGALVGRRLWFAHVGDSRIYVAGPGSLAQLTEDHSLAAEFLRKGGGVQTPPRARSVLTRCLGVREDVEVDVSASAQVLKNGSVVLVCSDGLSNQITSGEILAILNEEMPEEACRRLVGLARERGGPDNITALVARLSVA